MSIPAGGSAAQTQIRQLLCAGRPLLALDCLKGAHFPGLETKLADIEGFVCVRQPDCVGLLPFDIVNVHSLSPYQDDHSLIRSRHWDQEAVSRCLSQRS